MIHDSARQPASATDDLPDDSMVNPPEVSILRRRSMLALRMGVPVAILFLLWQLADGPEVLRILRRVDPVWIVAALVTANLQIILSAIRWKLTAEALEQTISTRRAIWEYYLAQLLNHTLPSGILGDAGRAVRMRHQAGMIRASQGVVIERMAGQIALFAVMMAGFAALPLFDGVVALPQWLRQMVLTIGLGTAAVVVVLFAARHVPGPVSRAASGFLHASRKALFARHLWLPQGGLSLLTVACNLIGVALCAEATGTSLPPIAVVTIVPLMLLAMLLPVSAGGWGLREGAAAALWPLVGATAASGVAASICFGLVILAAALPGLLMVIAPARMAGPPDARP